MPYVSPPKLFVATLCAIHAAMLALAATHHSPTYDEVAWLPAGLSHWELGRFDLARVNPPLMRTVAAIPVALVKHKSDWTNYSVFPGGRPEFQVGVDFMRANGTRSFWLFTLARWTCIPFSLLGGFVCYRWASELYGPLAGCLSATLWCFSPNVLAHAELVTADVAAAALGCAACYFFWRWLRQPGLGGAVVSGLLLGLAELTKTTWLLLFALWPPLWIYWRCANQFPGAAYQRGGWRRSLSDAPAEHDLKSEAAGLACMIVVAMIVLNLGYAFEGSLRPLGNYPFVSHALTVGPDDQPHHRTNRFRGSWLERLPVPLPENYVLGIDQTKAEFERGKRSYLNGQWKQGGWWYYYLYGLTVKAPLGTWLLAAIAVVATAFFPRFRRQWRDEIVLLAPAAALLLFVSSQTGFNSHLRYVLPAFPFAFIWLGKLAANQRYLNRHSPARWPGQSLSDAPVVDDTGASLRLCPGHPCIGGSIRQSALGYAMAWLTGAGLLALLVSSISAYPHSLAYFNALGGGWRQGHSHLLDSNIDWGQDLLYLRAWLDNHPESRPLGLAYFGLSDPNVAGIEFKLPPKGTTKAVDDDFGPRPGWYAISVNFLRGYEISAFDGLGGRAGIGARDYTYFLDFQPVAIAGRSIYIYHITLDDANRVRARLGVAALNDE